MNTDRKTDIRADGRNTAALYNADTDKIRTGTWRDWTIEEKIGEGSCGEVYRITRTEFGKRREAALKIIRVPRDQSETERMRRKGMTETEIRRTLLTRVRDLSAELNLLRELGASSHVVTCFDYEIGRGDTPGTWRLCVQMELLESLPAYCRRHPLCVQEVLSLGIDICRALEACEKRQIVHRDIKPANIFRTEDGRYKLGDFGISQRYGEGIKCTSSDGKSVPDSPPVGTRRYMAPEILSGRGCSSAADRYALAVVLLELLSGTEGGNRRLRRILRKASARDPSKRYPSAGELRAALEEAAKQDVKHVLRKRACLLPAAAAAVVLLAVPGRLSEQEAEAERNASAADGQYSLLLSADWDAVTGAAAADPGTDTISDSGSSAKKNTKKSKNTKKDRTSESDDTTETEDADSAQDAAGESAQSESGSGSGTSSESGSTSSSGSGSGSTSSSGSGSGSASSSASSSGSTNGSASGSGSGTSGSSKTQSSSTTTTTSTWSSSSGTTTRSGSTQSSSSQSGSTQSSSTSGGSDAADDEESDAEETESSEAASGSEEAASDSAESASGTDASGLSGDTS